MAPDHRTPKAASARWPEIDRIVDAALGLPTEERAEFVAQACGDDARLRSEVERLLDACARAPADPNFLIDAPAAERLAAIRDDMDAKVAMLQTDQPAALERALGGRYSVEREIGRGGMATVYLARDLRFDRPVAIKVLRPELARDCDVRRFLREIGRTAKLNHPHIVPIIDAAETGEPLCYVMPYMEGGTLRHRLAGAQPIPTPDAVVIARSIALALDCAHRHELIHRDVKPENILFAEGEPCLADFGIARALDRVRDATWSSIGLVRGTPEYMSPEQVSAAERLDGRSDVYSLGCVLYEMLAGRPPFNGRTPQAVMQQHLRQAPAPVRTVRPTISDGLVRAIETALAKDPAVRHPTAAAFASALGA